MKLFIHLATTYYYTNVRNILELQVVDSLADKSRGLRGPKLESGPLVEVSLEDATCVLLSFW